MNKQEKKIFDVAERFMRSLSGKEILIRLLLAGGMFQEYLILVNFIGFLLMGFDKLMAIQEGGRIPEKTFFAVSAVGGGAIRDHPRDARLPS